MITQYKKILKNTPQQPQTQAALRDQLLTLAAFANRLGLYDAADFIIKALERNE